MEKAINNMVAAVDDRKKANKILSDAIAEINKLGFFIGSECPYWGLDIVDLAIVTEEDV